MKNLWNAKEAAKAKDKLDLLVYSSRLIGSEPKLCVWGGGNTSTKTVEKDYRGLMRRVLRIKGSGSDLKVSTRKDYPPVALDDLLDIFKREQMTDEEMVDYVTHCLLDPKAPRPSIEVLLHAFVDQPDIHHTHADAILSITNTKNGKKIAKKIFRDELLWVPYVKPGFILAKRVGEAYRKNPDVKGVILEKHGLITWGTDAKTSYALTIEMVSRAERYLAAARRRKKYWSAQIHKTLSAADKKSWLMRNLPVIRQAVSKNQKAILYFSDSPAVMEFVNSKDAVRVSQIGPATPDHMLRTRRIPLYVIPARFRRGSDSRQKHAGMTDQKGARRLLSQIENYAKSHARYFERYKPLLPPGPYAKMLDPYPKVILIPGIGMVTTGSDLKNAKIVAEIYEHSISVMTHASVIDHYESLSEKLAFEMDYWPMELYKLSLAPAGAEFSRQIGLVTGAGRGIGTAIAHKLAALGAHVFLADLNQKAVEEAAARINEKVKSQKAFALRMDVTNPGSVRKVFEEIVLKTGGLDFLISNAGFGHVSPIENLKLEDWEKSLAVNATGHFLVARETIRLMKQQGMGGNIVFIASKNVLAPGKDFGAYSAAKAAEVQLARILAIENGEAKIRVNMINPDGVFENSGFWEKIAPNRAKTYGIPAGKLAGFYQNRNLMKTEVLPDDVAEAAVFFLSGKSSKTTGCILTVDGGVKEAFPR
ncbi:MAG: bifunctional rhamnulose-1-phosphate aldolase/short-chain dehydrogenase [Candidatus Omnitrophica bacterium]|nr:bifunctional rhamnulose-1-phosphate aldolase/short-chain dehydrogenase [Candidatus Omnitrophota bacterium]